MYTRLVLNVALKKGTPADVIAELQRMLTGDGTLGGRLNWMFGCSSYYHDNINVRQLIVPDAVDGEHKLSVVCDLKNYEDEITTICDWLASHVETDRCAGYRLYEEDDAPTLLYFHDGKAYWVDVQCDLTAVLA
jgi:hypothetical protein